MQREPQICKYVHYGYMPESWQVLFEIFLGVHQVQSCLSHTRKASALELLTAANNWPRGFYTKVELLRQYVQLEKFKSTVTLHQKHLTELRQKLCNHCDKVKGEQENQWTN